MTNYLTCWKCLGVAEPVEWSDGVGLHECQDCGIIFETDHYQKLWDKHQMKGTNNGKESKGK